MTRADARELAVHLIYSREFTGEDPRIEVEQRLQQEYYALLASDHEIYADRPTKGQLAYIDSVVSGVANRSEELSQMIARYSIGWDVSRISRVTRAIMQLCVFEVLYLDDVPTNVAISEAVRLAKKYDGDDTGAFVNGILGSFARAQAQKEE